MELIAQSIHHAYGDRAVLSDVSLHLGEGEIIGLLGPSGCGKSTLLRILGGLEAPTAGRVVTRGEAAPTALSPIAYIFQDFALVPWLTVEANIALPLEHRRMSIAERRARVRSALARVGLTEFSNSYPKQLSGGMRQRAGVARAFAVDPAILLLDEPTSSLDALTRELILGDFIRLRNERAFGAVYVTHDIDEALRIAHRIVLLSSRPGRIRATFELGVPGADRREFDPRVRDIRDQVRRMAYDDTIEAVRDMFRSGRP